MCAEFARAAETPVHTSPVPAPMSVLAQHVAIPVVPHVVVVWATSRGKRRGQILVVNPRHRVSGPDLQALDRMEPFMNRDVCGVPTSPRLVFHSLLAHDSVSLPTP